MLFVFSLYIFLNEANRKTNYIKELSKSKKNKLNRDIAGIKKIPKTKIIIKKPTELRGLVLSMAQPLLMLPKSLTLESSSIIESVKSHQILNTLIEIASSTEVEQGLLIDERVFSDGSKQVREDLGNGDFINSVIDHEGRILTDEVIAKDGERLIRYYFEGGGFEEIIFTESSGDIHSASFYKNGKVKFMRNKIDGKTYHQKFDKLGRVIQSKVYDGIKSTIF